jgi:hypothetical protein
VKRKPEHQYRILPGMKALDRRAGKREEKKRVPSKVLTASYNKFVRGYYSTHEPSRVLFIGRSVPYLIRNTSLHATCILAGTWFKNHGKGSYGAFIGEVKRVAMATPDPQNMPRMHLRSREHREALAIAAHLQSLHVAEFPLPVRELQYRMLLAHPEESRRILKALVKKGALELIDPGLSRPEASKLGEKARAATYRLGGRS